ncbi:MAG TPA: DNA mismatch repair protein MutS, partial [Leeuwenhoekiella sp.]|nr:DNA mismatch repair protein MutS [Leeuwenhoekiella sp.]
DMTDTFKRIKNYNVSIKELKDNVLFLRKLVAGGSAHSFGIHVAKMAGMPQQVLHRANKILSKLEQSHGKQETSANLKKATEEEMQLSFFKLDDPLLEEIKEEILHIDIDTLTPVEALMKLNEIKRMLLRNAKSKVS